MCVYLAMFANVHLVHLGNTEGENQPRKKFENSIILHLCVWLCLIVLFLLDFPVFTLAYWPSSLIKSGRILLDQVSAKKWKSTFSHFYISSSPAWLLFAFFANVVERKQKKIYFCAKVKWANVRGQKCGRSWFILFINLHLFFSTTDFLLVKDFYYFRRLNLW